MSRTNVKERMKDMEPTSQEWMTASQSKDRFGVGFGRLMALADAGVVDRRSLPADMHGDVSYLFRVDDVRNYIEGADNGNA